MLIIKILSIQYPERYVVRRIVMQAHQDLLAQNPGTEMEIIEIDDPGQICKYAFTIIMPTLVINEKVACSGRIPSREEVLGWLQEAI